jgi:hypothetical protein
LFRCFGTGDLGSDTVTTFARAKIIAAPILISDVLPFRAPWYGEPDPINNAIGYAKFYSRSRDAVIHVYDEAGNVIETHEHAT